MSGLWRGGTFRAEMNFWREKKVPAEFSKALTSARQANLDRAGEEVFLLAALL